MSGTTAVGDPPLEVLFLSVEGPVAALYRATAPEGWRVRALPADWDERTLNNTLADAEVVIHTDVPLDAGRLAHAPRLRFVQRQGVGLDGLDLTALAHRGIPVATCPLDTARTVAEHTLLLMLAVGRHLVAHHTDIAAGAWPKWDRREVSYGVGGRHVVLVGGGRIGCEVARLVLALGASVSIVRRRGSSPLPGDLTSRAEVVHDLDAVLPRAEVLSLHVPLTDQTRGMIDAVVLDRLPADAILINTARGGLIDEVALAQAVRDGRLLGAGLDTLASEPPHHDHPLVGLDRVTLTPHVGAGTRQTQHAKARAVVDNIRRFVAAEPVHDLVTEVN